METQISYFGIAEAPHLSFFRCDRLNATLSQQSCAANYKASVRPSDAERLHHCRNCPVGAKHCGGQAVKLSVYYGGNICSRCRRPAGRIIHKRICVSCQNREYEIIKGKNAKGQRPVHLLPLRQQRIKALVAGNAVELSLDRGVDKIELILSVLRNQQGEIMFGFLAPPPPVKQFQLRLL